MTFPIFASSRPRGTHGQTIGIEQEDITMNRGGFSWNRFLGISAAKRRVSRATGIPWTRSGRQRKVGSLFWKLFK